MYYINTNTSGNNNTIEHNYDHCRRLDYSYLLENKIVEYIVDTILSNINLHHSTNIKKNRIKKDKIILSVLISNLLRSIYTQDNCFSYSRKKTAYPKNYNTLEISQDRLIALSDKLKNAGYVDIITGQTNPTDRTQNRISRLIVANRFLEEFSAYEEILSHAQISTKRECIVLRNKFKTDIPYPTKGNSKEVKLWKKMKMELSAYNSLIAETDISHEKLDFELKKPIDLTRKFTRRIFIEDWEQLGRFYGSWWTHCDKRVRPFITINGNRTVEIDISSQWIGLLYAKAGEDLYENYQDPYTILNPEMSKLERKFHKTLLLLAVNNISKMAALSAFTNDYTKKKESKEKNGEVYEFLIEEDWADLKDTLDALKMAHSPLKPFFYRKNGLWLQNVDGKICAEVLREMTEQEIPVLSVHDSFIVEEQHEELLRQTICDAHRNVVKKEFNLDVGNPHMKTTKREEPQPEKPRILSYLECLPPVRILNKVF